VKAKPNVKVPHVAGVYGIWLYRCGRAAAEHEALPCDSCQLIAIRSYTPPAGGGQGAMDLIKYDAACYAESHITNVASGGFTLVAVGTGDTFQVWDKADLIDD